MLAIFLTMEVVIRYTTIGRKIKAVGGNREAAMMAGINVMHVKWGAYVVSGFLAGLGGIFAAINMSAASPDYGIGLEFRTITACAVGGISMAGGAGSMLGAGIGILFINILNNCLQLLKVESNWQLVVIGFVLVISVVLDNLKKEIVSRNI
jgi:ribose/xylose/arabinose/galactoside ABC-type transport system permease subunit